MNVLDVFLLALLGLAGLTGYHRGLTLQAFSFGGLLVGLGVGAVLAPALARLSESPGARAGTAVITLIVLAALGNALGWFVGHRVREHARATRFGRADAATGSVIALVASLLAVWFLALNLVNGPFPRLAQEIRGSAIVRSLDAALPDPPSLLAQARRFFNRFGFPDVFSGLPPPPAEPVAPPTEEEARAAAEAASRSTVLVWGRACDRVQEGSGFLAEASHVVTNAHVVAGVAEPIVQNAEGVIRNATTVLFDPELDLAVLRLESALGPALALASDDARRGDTGAVLGYPGGGPLDARSAAVLRDFEAVGRDIYGTNEIVRSVLELQAEVRPGNSGGPFVLPDGSVAGVVFAASSADDEVGYAIAADDVRPRVDDATARTAPVDTGPCLR
ncbi:MAG TPA: MarP family serine protease [Actinomycetota bacterium]|nr:MarP family serine protease [Actinomycetota bacterium]